jgi:hypothetical protein
MVAGGMLNAALVLYAFDERLLSMVLQSTVYRDGCSAYARDRYACL